MAKSTDSGHKKGHVPVSPNTPSLNGIYLFDRVYLEVLLAIVSGQHPNHFFLFFQIIAHQGYRYFIAGL